MKYCNKSILLIVFLTFFLLMYCEDSTGPSDGNGTSNHSPSVYGPFGPNSANVGEAVTFSAGADDGESWETQEVAVRFDWGDGTISPWSGFTVITNIVDYPEMTHTWSNTGTYGVRAQAKDDKGATSNWSDPHIITIISG
jgi:hypothetical protein